jgi:hypothetical protein
MTVWKRRVASLFGGAKYRASSFAPHRVNMLRVKHLGLYQGNPEGLYAFDGDAARGFRHCVGTSIGNPAPMTAPTLAAPLPGIGTVPGWSGTVTIPVV